MASLVVPRLPGKCLDITLWLTFTINKLTLLVSNYMLQISIWEFHNCAYLPDFQLNKADIGFTGSKSTKYSHILDDESPNRSRILQAPGKSANVHNYRHTRQGSLEDCLGSKRGRANRDTQQRAKLSKWQASI